MYTCQDLRLIFSFCFLPKQDSAFIPILLCRPWILSSCMYIALQGFMISEFERKRNALGALWFILSLVSFIVYKWCVSIWFPLCNILSLCQRSLMKTWMLWRTCKRPFYLSLHDITNDVFFSWQCWQRGMGGCGCSTFV